MPSTQSNPRAILYIGIFKLLKGVLLFIAGLGALHLLHKDVAEVAMRWADLLHVDPDRGWAHALLSKMLMLDDRKLKAISAGTFFYSGLLLTEGIGLLMHKTWAEYFTIITTAGLIPLEVYEIVEHVTAIKILVLIVNIAIVWYLVAKVIGDRREGAAG